MQLCNDIEKAVIYCDSAKRTEKQIDDFMPKVYLKLEKIKQLTKWYSQFYNINFENLTYTEKVDEQMRIGG